MSAFVRNLKFSNLQFLHFTQILRRFSSSSSSSSTPATEFSSLSEYLSKALGFSEQQSLQTCAKLARSWRNEGEKKVSDFHFAANALSVVDFLKETGFVDAHIRKVVFSDPRILTFKVDKTLKPKIKVLQDLGFSWVNIVEAISANYKLFQCGPNSSILSTVLALRQIVRCDSDLLLVIRRAPWIGNSNGSKYLTTSIAFLESSGISIESIRKALISKPRLFLQPTENFKDLVTRVENEFGILRSSGMFLSGLMILSGLKETTVKSKYRVFESFGWSHSDINAIVKADPRCLKYSEQRLKKSLNFLMKELGYEPKYLISLPVLLMYAVEKRLMPRHRILLVLKEKGFIRADLPLISAVRLTEPLFVKKFVVPFEEVHELYTKLVGFEGKGLINAENPLYNVCSSPNLPS